MQEGFSGGGEGSELSAHGPERRQSLGRLSLIGVEIAPSDWTDLAITSHVCRGIFFNDTVLCFSFENTLNQFIAHIIHIFVSQVHIKYSCNTRTQRNRLVILEIIFKFCYNFSLSLLL